MLITVSLMSSQAVTPYRSQYLELDVPPGTVSLRVCAGACEGGVLRKGCIPDSVTHLGLIKLGEITLEEGAITDKVTHLLTDCLESFAVPPTVQYLFVESPSVPIPEGIPNTFIHATLKCTDPSWAQATGVFHYGTPVPQCRLYTNKYECGPQTKVDFGGEIVYYVTRTLRAEPIKPPVLPFTPRLLPSQDPLNPNTLISQLSDELATNALNGTPFRFERNIPEGMDIAALEATFRRRLPVKKLQFEIMGTKNDGYRVIAWIEA